MAAYAKTDSATTRKYKQLFVENMRKVGKPGLPSQAENLEQTANFYLAGFYARENDVASLIDLLERNRIEYRLNAGIYNVLAYGYIARKDYKKAEAALRRATAQAGEVGDYWYSLAELYSLQGRDSLAVVYLGKALKSPQKSAAVSARAYQSDARWHRLRKRPDFQHLLKRPLP